MLPVQILGSGRALPSLKVGRETLERKFGIAPDILRKGPNVEGRYFCTHETQIDLALEASHKALRAAGKSPRNLDLIISGCGVPFQPLPSTAPLLMRHLGIADGMATAFDVNSTCLSFVTAIESAARMLSANEHRCALVFSSELASRALPWKNDPNTALLFGDGAAAVVLETAPHDTTTAIVATHMRCFPSAYNASQIGAGGTRFDYHTDREAFDRHTVFEMNGKELFRVTAQHFSAFLDELLDKAGWTRGCVDLVVPHQASPMALKHMVKLSGFSPDRVVNIVSQFGNQVAASIPFALDYAIQEGRLTRGDKLLLLGTSAGVSIGGAALEF